MPRLNVLELIVGRKGTGKTTHTRTVNRNKARVLYIMTVDHTAYRDLRKVEPKHLKSWKGGHIRIVGATSDELFEVLNRDVYNATICFEDATQYISFTLPQGILKVLINSKQKNNDIQLQFHSLRRVPMDLWDNANYLTLFKTRDDQSISKVPKYVWPIHTQILKDPNEYNCKTIALE
jgi:hypothetical protein